MALSVVTAVPSIAPVRNPVWYELFCGGYQVEAPVAAIYTLDLIEDPVNGDAWSLELPGGTVEFTFVSSTPDDSGTQVEIGANAPETVQNLLAALLANYWVDQAFVVTEVSDTIYLTARTAGAMDASLNNTSPPTLALAEDTAGSDGEYAEGYTANVQVWLEKVYGSGTYTPLPAVQGTPDEGRRVRWNLRSMFPMKYFNIQWPEYNENTPTLLEGLLRRFYLTRYEQHGSPPAPQQVDKSSGRTAWWAGTRNLEHGQLQTFITAMGGTTVLNPFLTWRGRADRHEVSTEQQHYLAWYRRVAKVTDEQLQLQATVYWTDGTNDATIAWTDNNSSGWNQYMVMLFPSGWGQLDLQSLDTAKSPAYYTLQVLAADDTPLSELHTFHVVDSDANELAVEYVNSLGVVDSLRCKGEWMVGMETEHELVDQLRQVQQTITPSVEQSDRMALLRGAQQSLQVSTGWMDKGELNAVLDVLMSPEWRWVDLENACRHPLVLMDAQHVKQKQGTDEDHLYALNLEFLVGDAEMAWSDMEHFSTTAAPDPEE